MDTVLIIANVLSLIGNALFTLSSILRNKKKILLCQSSNYVLAVISEFMTKAYSGMVQEAMSFIRNIILLFVKSKNKIAKLIITLVCVTIAVVAGILINIFISDNVWYGYLPVCGTIVYSTAVILAFMINCHEITSEFIIKIGLLINSFIWTSYGFFVKLYPIMIFNIITIILCIISIIRIVIIVKKHNPKNIKETESE
ncbi:MAG: YgjV family protein [Acholeplasmatales bacterium]|nr:YgjV family protein [Acholeplasmatales bacterium]